MRALVASPSAERHIELREVADPQPEPNEAVVAVKATSLNAGEVRALAGAGDGWRPGWDVAGEVVAAAADGSGPDAGERVAGLVGSGGWAERVAVRTDFVSPIPDALDFARASTLPVAGLTALRALAAANPSPDYRVLITGAAGGVGRFAIQLASHDGAKVTAVVGRPERGEGLAELGAHETVVGMPDEGEFDVILESVGGTSLAAALRLVAPCGTVVSFGNASREPTSFEAHSFFTRSGARLYAFQLLPELTRLGTACIDLGRLAGLVADGHIDAQIGLEVDWSDAAAAVAALAERRVNGKAVLHVGG